jgi:asparagine synthase (glutamine-hydrolysing)
VLWIDRFGIEPLCYRASSGTLGFADTACDVPGSARIVDRQSLFDYLFFHAVPAPQTVYADVRRLEAGHRLVARAATADAAPYWQPRFVEDDHRDRAARMAEFVGIVERGVAEEADDAATACFLSGGTDSSTIAGMLTRLRGAPADAYSIGFEAEGYDEMAYARIAARHFGLRHHEYYLTPDDLVRAIPAVAEALDQPFGNSSVLPAYFCAKRARDDGFTRMLAGDGGDELFGGNSRYAVQKAFELYHALPRRLRTTILEPVARDWALFRRVPGFRQLGGYVRHARADMPDRLNAFNLIDFIGIEAVLDPEFRAGIDPAAPVERQRSAWRRSRANSLTNRMLEYDWKFTLADSDLPKVRAATQLAGVSVGYPFLGRALTDFSLRVPPAWKVKRFTLRWFFKQALRNVLPVEILRKKKHGFGLPYGTWVLRHSALRELVDDALHGVARRGIVRPRIAHELLDDRLARAPSYYGELVWILMMLELWLRAHESQVSFAVRGDAGAQGERLAAGASR